MNFILAWRPQKLATGNARPTVMQFSFGYLYSLIYCTFWSTITHETDERASFVQEFCHCVPNFGHESSQNGNNSVSVGGIIQSHREKTFWPKIAAHVFIQDMKSQEQPRPAKRSYKKWKKSGSWDDVKNQQKCTRNGVRQELTFQWNVLDRIWLPQSAVFSILQRGHGCFFWWKRKGWSIVCGDRQEDALALSLWWSCILPCIRKELISQFCHSY